MADPIPCAATQLSVFSAAKRPPHPLPEAVPLAVSFRCPSDEIPMPIGKNSDGHQKTLRCPSVGTVAPNAQDSHDGNVFVLRRNRSDDGPVNRPRRSPTPKGTDSPLPYIYMPIASALETGAAACGGSGRCPRPPQPPRPPISAKRIRSGRRTRSRTPRHEPCRPPTPPARHRRRAARGFRTRD